MSYNLSTECVEYPLLSVPTKLNAECANQDNSKFALYIKATAMPSYGQIPLSVLQGFV